RPDINFAYFGGGTAAAKDTEALDALAEAMQFVHKIMKSTGLEYKIVVPDEKTADKILANAADLKQLIKTEAWGHHACGTCKIGNDKDPFAVLDGDFRVR